MSGFTRAPRLRLVGALPSFRSCLRVGLSLALALVVSAPLSAQRQHVVQQGDTLYAVAARYGTTVEALRLENDLSGSLVRVGQTLVLPGPAGFRSVSASAGESLAQVASRVGRSVPALEMANPGLGDPLATATVVRVPPGDGVSLRLEEGDSLLELALEFGVSPADLLDVNGLEHLGAAGVGEWIYLPVPPATAPLGVGGADEEEARPAAERVVAEPAWHVRQQEALLSRSAELLADFVPQASVFVMPLEGRLSSSFGWRDISVGGNRFHGGIDLAVDLGTPVTAALDGVVVRSGWVGAYGYAVYIEHGDGLQTRYAHLNELLVAVGDSVRQGDVIARAGSTGASTGPHLHFEIRVKGQAVDPLTLLSR